MTNAAGEFISLLQATRLILRIAQTLNGQARTL
jgi:hypothetical protein